MVEDASRALLQADAFHKDIFLMFSDLWAMVQKRGLSRDFKTVHDPEGSCWVVAKNSGHTHLFMFDGLGKIRFVQVLAKVNDDMLREKGTKYKAVCKKLGVDPVAPLVICYGTFEPRDLPRLLAGGPNLRRIWANHTVLLGVPDDVDLADPESYSLNGAVPLLSPSETNLAYFDRAAVKIRRLSEIRNSRDAEALIDDLLAM